MDALYEEEKISSCFLLSAWTFYSGTVSASFSLKTYRCARDPQLLQFLFVVGS